MTILNDKQYILEKAILIGFPLCNGKGYYSRDLELKWNLLPYIPTELYSHLKANSHHYSTKYHYEIVLPTLEKLFHFGFNINDFSIRKNLVRCDGEVSDLSFLIPHIDKKFEVCSLSHENVKYQSGYLGLLWNKNVERLTWTTKYHNLYCLPHLCSTIKNRGSNNGKSILILGDSQLIPSLAPLCYYYSLVTYIDNRDHKKILEKLERNYDDICIERYNASIDYYLNFLK